MASTPSQQIVSQANTLFKFDMPDYDDFAGVKRLVNGGIDAINGIVDLYKGTNESGPSSPIAGLLGPSSKAPRLIPNSIAPIDVKSDFAWTSSKADPARAEMPYVYLIEKVVDRSSRLQNLMYNTVSLLQSPIGTAAGALIGASAASAAAKNKLGTGKLASIGTFAAGAAGGAAGAAAANNLSEFALLGDKYDFNLKAFSGLYSTTPTNFSYRLPFVKTTGLMSKSISQSWTEESTSVGDSLENINQKLEDVSGSTSAGGLLGTASRGIGTASLIAKAADDVNRMMSDFNKSVFAAAYTETAKSYSYGGAPTFDISFYLFNNLTWADTVKNWYFVFGLQYQNLPNRLNRLILTPPVIYEAVVPGYYYSMYTYIKSLNVSYIGSSVLLDIPVTKADSSNSSVRNISSNKGPILNSTVKVVVPEVYKIDLTFESLVPESQNLMFEAMTQSRSNGNVPTITPEQFVNGIGAALSGPSSNQSFSLGSVPLGF